MAANHSEVIDATYVRAGVEPHSFIDPSCEATLIDGPGNLPPALRAMVEAELAAIDENTSIGQLVPATIAVRVEAARPVRTPKPASVLMTAHMPSDLAFDELLEEDAEAELHRAAPIALPVDAIVEPRTVHEYVEPSKPTPPRAESTRPGRYRAATPTGGRESDEFLVRPVSLSAPAPDLYDLSALAGVFEPVAFQDDCVTKTFFAVPGDTSTSECYEDEGAEPLPGFMSPAPRSSAAARGIAPQRYIQTIVGKQPMPLIKDSAVEVATYEPERRASPLLVAFLGFACIAAMFTQVL